MRKNWSYTLVDFSQSLVILIHYMINSFTLYFNMKQIISKWLVLLLALETLFSASGKVLFRKGFPLVKLTENAELAGSIKFSRNGRPYLSFLGIPFAKVRERFAAPELITKPDWIGIRNTFEWGPVCVQRFMNIEKGSEDCLNLNVFVPMRNGIEENEEGHEYPVMVWIHGGGFIIGSGSEYHPRYFMDENIILVTINYRLGIFGFLSTGDEVIPGNNGLKDQVIALQWIQGNIEKFGGNYGKVTIFGNSAGSASTGLLKLSKITEGLFHHVISQSGTALSLWTFVPMNVATENAVKVAQDLGCFNEDLCLSDISSEEILSCLRGISMERLNSAQWNSFKKWPPNIGLLTSFGPVVEPSISEFSNNSNFSFLTEPPLAILKNQPLKAIPMMIGLTEDECHSQALHLLSNERLAAELNNNWNSVLPTTMFIDRYVSFGEQEVVAAKLGKFYNVSDFHKQKPVSPRNMEQLGKMYSDCMATYDTFRVAVETASRGKRNPVYLYQYAYQGPTSVMGLYMNFSGNAYNENEKVGHGDELIHLFDLGETDTIKPDSQDELFSKNLVRLWASFATFGKPNHYWGKFAKEKWTPVSISTEKADTSLKYFRLDSNPRFIKNPYADRISFWGKLWEEHFQPSFLRHAFDVSKSRRLNENKMEL